MNLSPEPRVPEQSEKETASEKSFPGEGYIREGDPFSPFVGMASFIAR